MLETANIQQQTHAMAVQRYVPVYTGTYLKQELLMRKQLAVVITG